jgi:hypothetical protein
LPQKACFSRGDTNESLTWTRKRKMSEVIEIGAGKIKPQHETPCDRHLRTVNIELIVLGLALHTPGDYGDCSINHPIISIIDQKRPAHELLEALVEMDLEIIKGILDQLGIEPYDIPF